MSYNPNSSGAKSALSGSTSGKITQFASAVTTNYSIFWPSAQGAASTVLTNDGSGNLTWSPASPSGVTSVALSVPAFLSVVGSPITTTGTFTVGLSGTALPVLNGGTGQTSLSSSFNALSPLTTAGDILFENATPTAAALPIGATGNVLTVVGGLPAWAAPVVSGGTVTSVSVTSANGFAGTVATSTTTPAITISTTVTGLLKGDGTAVSAASAGTDYVIPSGSITGSSGSFTGSLVGDVTGTQGATVLSATTNSTLTTLSGLTTAASLAISGSQVSGGTFGAVNGSALTNLSAANMSGVLPVSVTGGSGLSIATSQLTGTVNLTTQASGTLQAAQEPAHTGDVTNTAGSLVLSLVATTNSTLTTLSVLSLPGSQVTGNISGNAANITASSNSTLTTLSALSLPYSQVTGTPTALIFADSLVNTSGTVTLVNDTATPGASKYYGTNGSSVLGYFSLPAGSVTSVSVVSANGLAGTVATATSTPAITLSTTITGILQGNGTAISAATTTGTGSVVLSAAPTLTGLLSGGSASFTSTIAASNFSGSSSGTNTGDQTITLTGDVTGSGTGSFATTIAAAAVTLPKMASNSVDENKIVSTTFSASGGITGGSATKVSILLDTVNVNGNALALSSNGLIIQTDNATIGISANKLFVNAHSITNTQLAVMPALTIKGNNTGASGAPLDLTTAQVNAILPVFTSTLNGLVPLSGGGTTNFLGADGTWRSAVTSVALTVPSFLSVSGSPITTSGTLAVSLSGTALPIANGGTNATTAAAAFNNLNPMTTTGDIIYESATGVASRLAVGSTNQVLTVISGAPSWQTPTTAPTLTSLGIRSGQATLSSTTTSKAVTFSSTLGTSSYAVTATMANTTDTNPQIQPLLVTAQSATGFTVVWNANLETSNYVLNWVAVINN